MYKDVKEETYNSLPMDLIVVAPGRADEIQFRVLEEVFKLIEQSWYLMGCDDVGTTMYNNVPLYVVMVCGILVITGV